MILGNLNHELSKSHPSNVNVGLKQVLEKDDCCDKILRLKFSEALCIVRATASSDIFQKIATVDGLVLKSQQRSTLPMDESLLKIVKKYGEKFLLKESDKKPKLTKRKGKKRSSVGLICKEKRPEADEWQGLPPWDLTLGGNGCPKFLCDVMVCYIYFFAYTLLSLMLKCFSFHILIHG